MTIDPTAIDHLAKLAELSLPGDAREHLGEDLRRMVAMIDALSDVATDGVAPLGNPLELSQRLRADTVTETNQREQLQAAAPETQEGFFIVPRVIE